MIAPQSADQDLDRQRQSQYLDFLDDEVCLLINWCFNLPFNF